MIDDLNIVYQESEYADILSEIDGVYFPIDKKWSKISLAISGGADSALMSYLILDIISKMNLDIEIHVISNIRCWKTKPWQKENSINVYNYLKNKFKNLSFVRHENFVPPEMEWGDKGPTMIDEYGKTVSGDNIELRAFAEYVCFNHKIDAYFNAVTKNPPNIKNGMPTRDIEFNKSKFYLSIMNHMGVIACHPFRFIEKSWILKKYIDLNLSDLLVLTRSCEGEIDNINYKNYRTGQYVPICGECFWCKERAWATEHAK